MHVNLYGDLKFKIKSEKNTKLLLGSQGMCKYFEQRSQTIRSDKMFQFEKSPFL